MKIKTIAALLLVAALTACGDTTETAQTEAPADGDAAIRKLHSSISAVDHQPYATPPRLVLTLNGDGWDEAAIFYGFALDAHAVLEGMVEQNLIPAGQDFTFILRAKGTDSEWRNVLDVQLPGAAVAGILKSESTAALLQQADVEFNGPMGRQVVTAFCTDTKYQGPGGLMDAPTFCSKAGGS